MEHQLDVTWEAISQLLLESYKDGTMTDDAIYHLDGVKDEFIKLRRIWEELTWTTA